jgi:2-dehydro-3-deoxyphosphogluconate aldolase/(4S)-4-hydroxy-2-oxoglutarate aldolase
MKNKPFSWEPFSRVPIVGIIRHIALDDVAQLLPLYKAAGLTTVEITMNTPGAVDMIRHALAEHGDGLNIGAGTVCSASDLELALGAGAQFIVAPIINEEVIVPCVQKNIPVFPGAYTPTEIYRAWKLGADMVKIFPATSPNYIKEIKAPLGQIKVLPTGGINLDNFTNFLDAGASGLGMGSQLFDKKLIAGKNWKGLSDHFAGFVAKLAAYDLTHAPQ